MGGRKEKWLLPVVIIGNNVIPVHKYNLSFVKTFNLTLLREQTHSQTDNIVSTIGCKVRQYWRHSPKSDLGIVGRSKLQLRLCFPNHPFSCIVILEWYYGTSTEESESKVVDSISWDSDDILYITCYRHPVLYLLLSSLLCYYLLPSTVLYSTPSLFTAFYSDSANLVYFSANFESLIGKIRKKF